MNEPQKQPSSAAPLNVKLIRINGVEGMKRRVFRLISKLLVIGGISGISGALGGHLAQNYERAVTGYHPNKIIESERKTKEIQTQQNTNESGFFSKALDVVTGAETITSLTESTQTYQELKLQYLTLLKLIDQSTYWTAFLLTFYAMAMILTKIDALRRKELTPMDEDIAENFKRIESVMNAIGKEMTNLQQGTLTKEATWELIEKAKQAQQELQIIETQVLKDKEN